MKKIINFLIMAAVFAIVSPISSYGEKFIKTDGPAHAGNDSVCILNQSKIYYKLRGKGVPVVFVAGLGDDCATWDMVTDSLKGQCLTLSYDRSGLGKSTYHGEKKDLLSMANELQALLVKIRFPGKFILVGHSLGCQVAKLYASLHPNKIRGIVFVAPGYDEDNLKRQVPDSVWAARQNQLKKYLPPFNAAQKKELYYLNADCRQADGIKYLPKVPIILFSGTLVTDFPASSDEIRIKLQTHHLWLKTLPRAKHIIVPRSRHYIQNDRPDLIVNAIQELSK